MEDVERLSSQLDAGMTVDFRSSPTVVEDPQKHPRITLYKNSGRIADQQRRWREELTALERKKKRDGKFDNNRGLRSLEDAVSEDKPATPQHPWAQKPTNYRGKSWRSYSNHLMLAEWLLFLPPTFSESYLMKLCPKGRHVFVWAAKGSTRIISRTGAVLVKTVSRLPGGGLGQSEHQNRTYCSMLDCILVQNSVAAPTTGFDSMHVSDSGDASTETPLELKVLDLVRYRGTCYTHLSFRERSCWLEQYLCSQLEEFQEGDPVLFEVVPAHSCDPDSLNAVLSVKPKYEVDGILFYHELVNYEPGATPLVGWLKPYMLTEWFPQVTLHPDYMIDIPADYTNYLNEVRAQEERARLKNKSPNKANCDSTEQQQIMGSN